MTPILEHLLFLVPVGSIAMWLIITAQKVKQ